MFDLYAILEVKPEATTEEIKKSYRKKCFDLHPDRNINDPSAVVKFRQVQNAYETLGDEAKRAEYDRRNNFIHKKPAQHEDNVVNSASRRYTASQTELDTIQCQFFGGSELHGRNILLHMLLTKSELLNGVTKGIKWKKFDKCRTCDGYGAADLKNSEFTKCEACKGTGNIMQIPKGNFPKCDFCDGAGFLDMFCKTCKGKGLYPNMVIEETMMEIPAGTPSGHQFIIRGRGEFGPKGGLAGNLHVVAIEQN